MIILDTHRVNNNNDNSIDNEADVGNNGVPDDNDNYVVIYDRTDAANPPPLPPESNNHNQDLENCYDDHNVMHSEFINSNPSMIPNDGERVLLLSLVSRVVKNSDKEKNDEVKNVHQYDNSYDDEYVDTTSATELECLEWILKKYRVDNDNVDDTELETVDIKFEWYTANNNNTVDTKLEWILKRYRVDNDNIYNTELEWSLKKYRVDNDKINDTVISQMLLLFRAHPTECCFIMKRKDGECHMKAKFHTPDPLDYLDGICSNSDPLKRTHSPQGMLSLIDRTGCSVMKRENGECPNPEVKLYQVKLYHQEAYQQKYLGKTIDEMDHVWGDNKSIIYSPTIYPAFHNTGNTAELFLDDTLEVDVSIVEGSIFGILGSDKCSFQPMTQGEQAARVCGTCTTIKEVE